MTGRRDPLRDLLGPLDGGRIPGGCDSCDAYQVPECVANNFWVIKVFHDDWCPLLRASEEARR